MQDSLTEGIVQPKPPPLNGVLSWLFSFKGSLRASQFALGVLLAFVLHVFLYNIYFSALILFPSAYFFLDVLGYVFPFLSVYMFFCVLAQRLRVIYQGRLLYIILIVSLCFIYLMLISAKDIGMLFFDVFSGFIGSPGLLLHVGMIISFSSVFFSFYSLAGLIIYGLVKEPIGAERKAKALLPIGLSLTFIFILLITLFKFNILNMWLVFMIALFGISKRKEKNVQEAVSGLWKGAALLVLILCMNSIFSFPSSSAFDYASHDQLLQEAKDDIYNRQKIVADRYAQGVGFGRDLNEAAIRYDRIARTHENVDAAYYAALAYEEMGNLRKAELYYKASALSGSDWARQHQGVLTEGMEPEWQDYDLQVCELKSVNEDMEKCRKLAIAGNGDAQLAYAEYLAGLDEKYIDMAPANVTFWYEQAAHTGSKEAARWLAADYHKGKYHRRDLLKAAYWCERLVELGEFWYFPRLVFLNFLT